MNNVIGFTGYAGSGKDTIADCLTDKGYYRLAFADALKELAWEINPVVDVFKDLPVTLQEFVTNWGGAEDDLLGKVDLVKKHSAFGRGFLQHLGQAQRKVFGPEVWIELLDAEMNRLWNPKGANKFVITDVRYENEAEWIQSCGGCIIAISRPSVGPLNGHVSEQNITDLMRRADYTVTNAGTPQDAANDILSLLQ